LWQALDVDEAFAQVRQRAGSRILPLIIESDQAAVHQLPWETLYHPDHGFLGKTPGFTLARRIPRGDFELPDLQPGPLRVLLFTVLPDDPDADSSQPGHTDRELGSLDVEDAQAQVQEALAPWIARGMVELRMPDDGRFATLKEIIASFEPHLLFHFGHGKFIHQPHSGEKPFATLQFENETGGSTLVHEEEYARLFYGSSIRCVVLAACESGMTASDPLNNGLAWRLSQAGIPHVIGMRESILQRAGILFNRRLCDALAQRERVDVALQDAREAITTPLKESPLLAMDAQGLGELSLGQWCLPALITQDAAQPLVEWQFEPQPAEHALANITLDNVTLPPRFLGRRSELRQLKSRLRRGTLQQLLITGPGGQGKTALAGKLALDLLRQGYQVLAYAARPENIWRQFFIHALRQLNENNRADYASMEKFLTGEFEKAEHLLNLLLKQYDSRVVLFFDNLEAVQDPDTQALEDSRIAAWIAAAQKLGRQGLILLLTSRWRLPGWLEEDHLSLAHANYGDFLQMARQHLSPAFLRDRERLRQVYRVLHGNGRGLTFFAAAIQDMDIRQEDAFLRQLAEAEAATQTDMALAQIVSHLEEQARRLLERLPAYQSPVSVEGILKLSLDLPQPEILLKRLLAVSLVEPAWAPRWQTVQYQLSPLVAEWLLVQGVPPPDKELLQTAARYQEYLYRNERRTLAQALLVHQALRAAGEIKKADRFALDRIVGPLNRQGLYETLLSEWLPAICSSEDRQIKGEALGQTGKQHLHLGDYETALSYLERSLQIRQEIGDKSGEGTTLNNSYTELAKKISADK
jgi:archaellum biogenesis ATPase FlaH